MDNDDQGILWEVFIQVKAGRPYKHIGSLHAYDMFFLNYLNIHMNSLPLMKYHKNQNYYKNKNLSLDY